MRPSATFPKRPKWANPLTKKQWADLCRCQCTDTPTLRQLRADLEYQRGTGARCDSCESAARAIGA